MPVLPQPLLHHGLRQMGRSAVGVHSHIQLESLSYLTVFG